MKLPTSTRVVLVVALVIFLFVCAVAAQGFRGVRWLT